MRRKQFLFLALFLVLNCATAADSDLSAARPSQILIIRHAEKPPDDDASFHLNEQGKKRAAELPKLFIQSTDRPQPFPKPDFIFAAENSKKSHRSVETVTQLAMSLELPVNADFENEREQKLKKEIFGRNKYAGKIVLICWHQGTIPELARELGVAGAPANWPKSVFDRVWIISYDKSGSATLSEQPQRLLPGDSK